ncbi:putative ribonuclease H-like domain-containing protein [Tanacetum coccineum]
MIDYALWEVIENGATLQKTQVVEGVEKVMSITSTEDKAQRRLEVKARSTLMMGIPNEHQLKFNSIKDAKLLLEAIEKRFGRNEATKKTQRNLLKQQYENFTAPSLDMLNQTFISSKARIQEEAYVNSNMRLDLNKSKVECYNCHKRGHFDRECRAPRNQDNKNKEISRSVPVETSTSTTLVPYDGLGGYDWSDQAEEGPNYALMAYSSLSSDLKVSNDSNCSKSCMETIKLLKYQNDQLLRDLEKSSLMVLGYKTDKIENASKSLDKLIECQIVDNCKKGLGYEKYNAVPPPYTGNFMPSTPDLSFTGLDEFVNKPVVKNRKFDEEVSKDQGVIDSRCSRHMTGNMSYLTDYEEIDGGYVAFGENPKGGKITRKGTKASDNAGQARKETEPVKDFIFLPLWTADTTFSQDLKSSLKWDTKPTSDDGNRNKKDERGIVIRNKARLVAQGYTQEGGINYISLLPLFARMKQLCIFAYASFKDFVVYQMDVKSAFLYGKIEEEVYVCQPPGFEDPDFPDRVYKVEKALYGLHQAPRAWYETLSTYLLDNGFQRGKIDKTLFIKRHKGDILLVQVYVDDIIFGSTKKELCNAFEKLMHEKFQMSSMGELTFFLGLQVQQKKDGIFISQDKYMEEILKKFGFTKVKTASTPMETQKPLLKDEDGEEVDVHMYRSMIGSLMYLTSSRLDIIFAVCTCARYQVNPKVLHLHAVKRFLVQEQTVVSNSITEADMCLLQVAVNKFFRSTSTT